MATTDDSTTDHEQPARFIALDTQMLLQFTQLNQLRPEDFGVPAPATWLITVTVEREIQGKKSSGERLQRRARQVDKLLDDRSLQKSIRRFRPSTRIDYDSYHLDPQHSDDKILGELIAFRNEHPTAALYVVSDDGGFRRTAADLGFTVVAPADTLRLATDSLELENAELRKKLAAFENSRPRLELTTDPRPLAAGVGEPLSDERLQDAVDKQAGFVAPDPDGELFQIATTRPFALASGEPNPKYREQRLEYLEAFRMYYSELYRVKRRLVAITLHLVNSGDVAAENVDVDVRLPVELGAVYAEPPAEPELPNAPETHKSAFLPWRVMAQHQSFYGPLNASALRRIIDTPPPVDYGPRVVRNGAGEIEVRFHRAHVKQRSVRVLPQFYIVLHDDVRGGLHLTYEVRSKAPGVESGTIDVRLTIDGGDAPGVPMFGKDDPDE